MTLRQSFNLACVLQLDRIMGSYYARSVSRAPLALPVASATGSLGEGRVEERAPDLRHHFQGRSALARAVRLDTHRRQVHRSNRVSNTSPARLAQKREYNAIYTARLKQLALALTEES